MAFGYTAQHMTLFTAYCLRAYAREPRTPQPQRLPGATHSLHACNRAHSTPTGAHQSQGNPARQPQRRQRQQRQRRRHRRHRQQRHRRRQRQQRHHREGTASAHALTPPTHLHCCYRSRDTGGDGGGGNGGGGGGGSHGGGKGDGGVDRGGDGGGSSGGEGGGDDRCCVLHVMSCHAMLVCMPVLMILTRLWPLRRAMRSRKQPKTKLKTNENNLKPAAPVPPSATAGTAGCPPRPLSKTSGGAGATPSLRQGRPEAYQTLTPEGNPLRRGGIRKYLPGTNDN